MGGGSKGGGGHTPYEAPDSLKSAQKLRAIGLISLGPIKGTVNKWKTTYFDNTPIQNENGKDDNDTDSFNFKNTEIQFTLGTQDQLPLKGFEASEREVPVNAEVKHAHPLTKTVIDPDVSRLRLTLAVSALFSQNDQGDTHGTSVTFEVLINNLPRNTYTIEGKSSSRFFRSYIIENLPEVPFTVTVKRVTEDSKSQRLQNATSWASYTEIIDTKLSYPNMALVGIKTDSRYNPNFPNINFLLHGRLVKIPSNYDPVARTYAAGIWKGDFKEDWTNNPAWVFYDLVTNKQIGLGERLGDFGVDKFQLYQIAQYCDQLVPDGYGGQEPRMTANLWITDQRSAYEVLSDMASVFRAMVIWNGQQMTATQDRPTDPVCTYTQSNVIDGKFTRQYVAQKAIYTAVEVEYADKRNMYQKAIEYVADDDLIRRYGYNVKKITAFACTSRGQAHRYGKWILETSRLEQCTITFSVGREGLAHLPGDIIEVADNRYANTNLGGRVLSINGKTVTLDRPIDFTPDSYLGYLSTEDVAEIVRVKILSVDDKQRVNLEREPAGLVENANWTLHTAQVKTQLYRAIGIAENEDGSFAITALQHEPQKESIVDNGANFEPSRSTLHQGGLVPPSYPDVTTDGGTIKINFQPPPNFVGQGLKYQVKLYRNGNLYKVYDDLQDSSLAFNDLPDGEYVAEIRAKNSAGQLSEPITKAFSVNFNITQLVTVSKVFGIDLSWKNPLFAAPNASIEIWVSNDNQLANARKLVALAYPTNSYSYTGLGAAETYWFWARMVNKDAAGRFTVAAEGITERSPQKLVDALHGAITKSELSQELIKQINSTEGVAEAKELASAAKQSAQEALNKAQAEAQERAKALQAEAQARGNAVKQLENVDKQQAQAISQVTAKAESAVSGLETEKTARIAGDQAEAKARETLTNRVGNAESSLNTLSETVTRENQATTQRFATMQSAVDSAKSSISTLEKNVAESNRTTASKLSELTVQVTDESNMCLNPSMTKDTAGWNSYMKREQVGGEWVGLATGRDNNYGEFFPVSAGEKYHVSMLVKNKDATQEITLGLFVKGTSSWWPVVTRVQPSQATDWVKIEGTITLWAGVREAQLFVLIEKNNAQAGSWYIKNVTLYREGKALKARVAELGATIADLNGELSATKSSVASVERSVTGANGEITTIKANVTAEQQARINGDKANSDAINNLTSRVGSAESTINGVKSTVATENKATAQRIATLQTSINGAAASVNTLSKSVTDLSGKLSATHTIKTQAIGGGRTAIAGIALGASSDGKTAESSVIVMADKFSVVKNAADNQVKPVFTIANGKTALSGDIVVTGDLVGNKFTGGEIDISGKDGVLKVGRSGSFVMRSSNQNRGLYIDSQIIVVYDENGRVRVRMGKLR